MRNFFHFILLMMVINISVIAQQGIDSIHLSAGWNLIGSLRTGSIDSVLSTHPPNIISSPFWGFNPDGNQVLAGYFMAPSLSYGSGYWVKCDIPGWLFWLLFPNCGTVSYDGEIYGTVVIGTQCWLRRNLDVGARINGTTDQTDNGVIEKFCYNNNPANCNIYGGLYQWDEAMQYVTTPGAQGICPNGWHIPTLAEFTTLSSAVDFDGNALKAVGQGSGDGAGTNTSGFSALLAGDRNSDGTFDGLGNFGRFWSSTENTTLTAYFWVLSGDDNHIGWDGYSKSWGWSVRCLKDD